jgi:hypothetical protein
MGELYYTELGGKAGGSIPRPDGSGEGPFSHTQPYLYWAGSQTAAVHGNGNGHSTFSFGSGFQGANTDTNELYVIPVFDAPRKVTNDGDSGVGSLRSVIDAAHGGDTILFAPSLIGQTIDLNSPITIGQDNVFEDKFLDIRGPGAGRLAINGSNTTGLFEIGLAVPDPDVMPVAERTDTSISGLTFENGQSPEGGAILDYGFSLTLKDDEFEHDQAIGGPNSAGLGGALALLGESTTGMSVRITDCLFDRDSAVGGAFSIGVGSAGPTAGAGEGGAIDLDARDSTNLSVVIDDSEFSNNRAVGGSLGGGSGGVALGGAFYSTVATAIGTSVTVEDSAFIGNSAQGGSTTVDAAQGGMAAGGGLAFLADSDSGSARVDVTDCLLALNTATGGDGNVGGSAFGGGIYLASNGSIRPDTWILRDDLVAANRAVSGNGGVADSFGGGIYDGYLGTLDLLGVVIVDNEAEGSRPNDHGSGGGIAIAQGAVAKADGDTRIRDNHAAFGPDVFGDLGTM